MASKKMIVTFLILGLVAVATGCSDNNNAIVAAPDTAPPALPSNLTIVYSDGVATVNWEIGGVDNDLAGYIVTREWQGETEALVATPTLTTSYEDHTPMSGSSAYHVYSVDTTGNESAAVTTYLKFGYERIEEHLEKE